MNRRLIHAMTTAIVASGALALAAAQAQPAGDHHPGPPGARPMADMKAMHETMMRQHMEDMKTVLRLRPGQEPALAAFMASHGHMGMEMHGAGGGMHQPPKAKTTPERLEQMAKHEAAMTAEREKQRQALAKFYAALDPEQQKVFDAAQRLQRGGHGGPMMKRGGPGGAMQKHGAPH